VDLLPEKVTQLCLRPAGSHERDDTDRQTNRLDKLGAADHHVAPRDRGIARRAKELLHSRVIELQLGRVAAAFAVRVRTLEQPMGIFPPFVQGLRR
jgi:hypothetical protein